MMAKKRTGRGQTNIVMVRVEKDAELPVRGQEILTTSELTGITYRVRVSSIVALRWLRKGAIEVTVRGTKSSEARKEEVPA